MSSMKKATKTSPKNGLANSMSRAHRPAKAGEAPRAAGAPLA